MRRGARSDHVGSDHRQYIMIRAGQWGNREKIDAFHVSTRGEKNISRNPKSAMATER